MKSSYLINLVLVLVIAVLYWLSSPTSSPTITSADFSNIDVKSIKNITIQRRFRNEVKLHKQDSDWQIVQPIKAVANNTRIKLLLSLLNSPSHNQLTHPTDELIIQLGLKPIKLSLQLNEHLFVFGDIEPINKWRYVLYENTVYLMDDQISPLLNANAASFINNHLLAITQEIKSIHLPLFDNNQLSTTESITIDFHDGHWQSQPPSNSTDKLATVIKLWQHAEALQVIPIDSQGSANNSSPPSVMI